MRRADLAVSAALHTYAHPGYAASLAEFGTPRMLPRSGGWLLERPIQGGPERDAIGCYPLFTCLDWGGLERDLTDIGDLVSLVFVSDPFGDYGPRDLVRLFGSLGRPFKEHFVVDLTRLPATFVSRHHVYYARRASMQVAIERVDDPSPFVDEWTGLYATLASQHGLTGIRAFSRAAFEAQLRLPGMVLLRAMHQGTCVAAHIWAKGNDVVYSHLAAATSVGYELMASYALHQFALQTFQGEARWLDLGAGAGLVNDGSDGLSRFKRGWASGTRTAMLCGRILDHEVYQRLATSRDAGSSSYFPIYRTGELV